MSAPAYRHRERSGCLGLWLTAGMILNPLMVVLTAFDGAPGPVFCLTGLFGLVNFLCFLAIWNWQKWGVYGLYISFSISLLLSLLGGSLSGIIGGITSLSILYFLTGPVMDLMD